MNKSPASISSARAPQQPVCTTSRVPNTPKMWTTSEAIAAPYTEA
jgi:hypothetical protein